MSLYKIFPYDLDVQSSAPDPADFIMVADSQDQYKAKKMNLSTFMLLMRNEFPQSSSLARVAFTGNYNDLVDKPNITESIADTVRLVVAEEAMLYALIFG